MSRFGALAPRLADDRGWDRAMTTAQRASRTAVRLRLERRAQTLGRGFPAVRSVVDGGLGLRLFLERRVHDRLSGAFDDVSDFLLFRLGHLEPVERLLEVVPEGEPLVFGDHQMAV